MKLHLLDRLFGKNQKKILFRGLALLMCLSMILGIVPGGTFGGALKVQAVPNDPVNLIANGDFEVSDTQVPNWTIKASRVGFGIIKSGVVGNDTNVLSMKQLADGYLEVVSDKISVKEGQEYQLSLKHMVDNDIEKQGADQYWVHVWMNWWNGDTLVDQSSTKITPTEQWQDMTLDVTVPAGATTTEVVIYINVGKIMGMFLDDVILIKTSPDEPEAPTEATQATEATQVTEPTEVTLPAEDGMVDFDLNWSFEYLGEDGLPTAWKLSGGGMTINTTDKVNGSNALQIDASVSANGIQSYPIPVANADDQYEVTFKVKRLSGDSAIYMGIWFGKEPHKNYDNWCCNAVYAEAGNEWKEYTVSWPVYKDASYMWLEVGNHSKATVSYLIDDITLKINGEVVKTIKVPAPEEPEATEPEATQPEATEPTAPAPAEPVVLYKVDFNPGYNIYNEWTVTSRSMIIGWTGDVVERDTYEGGRILLMQDNNDASQVATSKKLAVIPSAMLELTYWAKDHWDTANWNSDGSDVKLVFFDASGNELTDATVVQPACGVQEWTLKTVKATVPANAAEVCIVFTTGAENTKVIYGVDLLTLTQTEGEPADPNAPVYVFEDDFETFYVPEGSNKNVRIPEGWTTSIPSSMVLACWPQQMYEGKYSLIIMCGQGAQQLTGPKFAVAAGNTYTISFMEIKHESSDGTPGYLKFVFMDADGNELSVATEAVGTTADWTERVIELTAPAGAVQAYLAFGVEAAGGPLYMVDNLAVYRIGGVAEDVLPEEPAEPEPTVPATPDPTVPENVRPDEEWIPEDYERPVIENFPDSHPYLYFDADGLEELKQLKNDATKNIYGFTWKGQISTLLATADFYLTETQVHQLFNYGDGMDFEVYPTLRDVNDLEYYRPLYEAASKDENGKLVEYPYLGFGSIFVGSVQTRLEVLSMAYSLTGDTRYSDLAIRYAVELCQWEWWGDWNWLYTYSKGSLKADAANAWALQGVAAVYDMCYEILTEEQRELMATAIIEKGLIPLSQEVDPFDTQNVNMMMIGGLLTGCAAIINEDNYEEIKPLVDLALYCTFVAFDNYAYSGNTEGHYYTSYGLEYFLPGVSHMYQATGLESLFDHPLMSTMLPYWTVQFASPASMAHPNYSDASINVQMKLPMAIISKNVENGFAGYFMTRTGGLGSPWANLVYLDPTPVVEEPTDLVAVVDPIGYGALRTGFANDDMMLTLLANDSQMGHNHLDQNAIQLSVAGSWQITDPGVGSYYYADRSFWKQNGHSTILVDNKAQTVKGTGTMEKIFGSRLYGYIIGSAAEAYGYDTLEKFDRHAIQLNHEEKAYYIIIDDLASSQERTYTWQMYNGDRLGFTIDGINNPVEDTLGNEALVSLDSGDLRLSFVDGDKLTMGNKDYSANGEVVGYTFVASSAATKTHQFMTVISTESAFGRDFIKFPNLLKAASREFENMDDDGVSWKTSATGNRDMVKHNTIGTQNCLFFRGGAAGDFVRVPITVKETGVYDASISLGVSSGCCQVKVYLDDHVSEVVDCSGYPEYFKEIEFKGVELKAGRHYVTVEIVDKGLDKEYVPGYFLVNMAGMYLNKQGEETKRAESVLVKETYDDENALGALINYAGDLCDLVMFNRTDALVAAGKLSTDGQQASVLGLDNGKITEGFSATKATKLIYDGKTLFESEKALNIVADAEGWHIDTAEAQTVKLNIGAGELISVTVNGEKTDATYENGMITVALDAGQNEVAVDMIPAQPEPIVGDLNGDNELTDADAIYLLYATFDPDGYPLCQNADYNGDGELTDADAIYLLYATFDPDGYPLN